MTLTAPATLDASHQLENFVCADASLTSWLKTRALKNHASGATRCFVVCDRGHVVGYYALAAGAVELATAPGKIRRNMPDPIPLVVLGRLAVHEAHAGRGIGSGLLKDAVLRSQRVATDLGARALLCHALDEGAKAFYRHHGFVESPTEPLTMMLALNALNAPAHR